MVKWIEEMGQAAAQLNKIAHPIAISLFVLWSMYFKLTSHHLAISCTNSEFHEAMTYKSIIVHLSSFLFIFFPDTYKSLIGCCEKFLSTAIEENGD